MKLLLLGFGAKGRTSCFLGLQGDPHFPVWVARRVRGWAREREDTLQLPSVKGSACFSGFPNLDVCAALHMPHDGCLEL